MGCWKGTCAASNLYIDSNSDVVAFVIAKHKNTNYSPSFAADNWFPIPVPIYGKYDDYGGVLVSEDERPVVNQLVALINKATDGYSDVSADTLFRDLHRGRIEPSWSSGPLKLTLFHRSLVDKIKDEYTFGLSAFHERTTFSEILPKLHDVTVELLRIYNSAINESISNSMELDHDTRRTPLSEAFLVECRQSVWFGRSLARSLIHDIVGAVVFRGLGHNQCETGHVESMYESIKCGDYDLTSVLVEKALVGVMMKNYMDDIRAQWIPSSGVGSQHGDPIPYKIMVDFMVNQLDNGGVQR